MSLRKHTDTNCSHFFICLVWMFEVIWGEYQPQPWCWGIISTPQLKLNPQIWGQLGRCNGIRVKSYALETAYQWLKHFVCVFYGYVWCNLWWISASTMTLDSIIFTPQVNLTYQIWGQLGQCNRIRLQPYALETAYLWLKHFVYS